VEAELIEPEDKQGLSGAILAMHHVGYVVADIEQAASTLRGRGLKFAGDAPGTNVVGQQVFYLDSTTTNGVMVHLTQLPSQPDNTGVGQGLEIEGIVHTGYLVPNLDEAVSWYVERLGGQQVGGGPTPTGGRAAFVNFGQAQVELIEPGDPGSLAGSGHAMDHVGYVVADILACSGQCRDRGLKMATEAPGTNPIGQQVFYLDTATSLGSRMHLTQQPD
jgi:catechol 2,3-dioxygenase-like lactoylglutathione lyase family enzyme